MICANRKDDHPLTTACSPCACRVEVEAAEAMKNAETREVRVPDSARTDEETA
jgi:hypothetical protein